MKEKGALQDTPFIMYIKNFVFTLSYDLACGKGNTSQTVIKVKCDGTEVAVPAVTLEKANVFYPVSITNIPTGTKKITFVSDSENTMGFRLDNIKS